MNNKKKSSDLVVSAKSISEQAQEAEVKAEKTLESMDRRRSYKGTAAMIVGLVAIATSCYHLYYAFFHPFFDLNHRSIHWLFISVLTFSLYPFSKKRSPSQRMTVLDGLLMIASVVICLWLFLNSSDILNRAGSFETIDVIMGTALVLLVLEASRRTTGPAVSLVALAFLAYAFFGPYLPDALAHRGYSLERVSTYLSLTTDGIFGICIAVSANFILLFILYGAILRKTGAGQFLTDVAFALTGRTRGGPAKAAVVSSTFFGMISGSSIANTVTTGTFTIPLMKRTGYPAHFAGGVESSSSVMGMIMPPIMGAAAFIMAEVLGIPYLEVCVAAAIPATLAFFGTFMQVHFRAVSLGLAGMAKADLPSLKAALKEGWHHIFSVCLLIYCLFLNYSPERAVVVAIIAQLVTVLVVGLVKGQKLKELANTLVDALRTGAMDTVEVAAACAAAGIIIGCVTMTGLGISFSSLVVDASMGKLWLALPLTMLACLVLGMGVPVTAQYVIVASLVAPALTQMGVVAIGAHLFVLYFGTRADITPPVALAAYAAAGIAKSPPMKTGVTAFKLGIAGYIIPFMFVYAPELLFIGSLWKIAIATATAILGIVALAAAVQRCFLMKCNWYEMILLFSVAFLMIKPGIYTDVPGLVLFGLVYVLQTARKKKVNENTKAQINAYGISGS